MTSVISFLGGATPTARCIVEVQCRKRPVWFSETCLHPPAESCVRAATVDEQRATPCERHATRSAHVPSSDGYDFDGADVPAPAASALPVKKPPEEARTLFIFRRIWRTREASLGAQHPTAPCIVDSVTSPEKAASCGGPVGLCIKESE